MVHSIITWNSDFPDSQVIVIRALSPEVRISGQKVGEPFTTQSLKLKYALHHLLATWCVFRVIQKLNQQFYVMSQPILYIFPF